MIYFIKTGNFVLIKFVSLKRELKQLIDKINSFNPFPPTVIASIDKDAKTQKVYDKLLKDSKIKENWYLHGDQVDEIIKNPELKYGKSKEQRRFSRLKIEAKNVTNEIVEKYADGAKPSDLQKEYALPKKVINKIIPKDIKRINDNWSFKRNEKRSRKPVLCIDTGEVFPNANQASIVKEAPKVSEVCRGRRKTANKLRFRYLEEKEIYFYNILRDGNEKIFLKAIEDAINSSNKRNL